MRLRPRLECLPLVRPFRIARGAVEAVRVVVVEAFEQGVRGRGEARPYPRFGEEPAEVLRDLEAAAQAADRGGRPRAATRAGRAALEAALLDLRARREGRPAHFLLGVAAPGPVRTFLTIEGGTPSQMEERARRRARAPRLKVKAFGPQALRQVEAVRRGAPEAALLVDANEGWPADRLGTDLRRLAALGVVALEQPLPAGLEEALPRERPVPILADEAFFDAGDVERVAGNYDGVVVKLEKAGGPRAALAALRAAREAGLRTMVGSMVASSLGVAPAFLLAGESDLADLDGPLWLARDRPGGVREIAPGVLSPPTLWGLPDLRDRV